MEALSGEKKPKHSVSWEKSPNVGLGTMHFSRAIESEALPLYPLSFGAGEKILPIWSVVRLSLSTWLPVFPNAVSRAKEEAAALRACAMGQRHRHVFRRDSTS